MEETKDSNEILVYRLLDNLRPEELVSKLILLDLQVPRARDPGLRDMYVNYKRRRALRDFLYFATMPKTLNA